MSEPTRFIEVTTVARVDQAIKEYQATVEIVVTASKYQLAVQPSLKLRDQVIAALREADLGDDAIEEGSGEISQNYWGTVNRTIRHQLHVRDPKIAVLVEAMAKVEELFIKRSAKWFAPIKESFTFNGPVPVYKQNPNTAKDTLAKAVDRARSKAEQLAAKEGLVVGRVMQIVEEKQPQSVSSSSYEGMDSGEDFMLDDDADDFGYTPAAPRRNTRPQTFRVRFDVSDG